MLTKCLLCVNKLYIYDKKPTNVITTMKNILILAALFISTIAFAQNNKPTFEKDGDLVKGTYYFDNGEVRQSGTYKEGKLHGEWTSFNDAGDKVAVGNYTNGTKSGKWFFWNGKELSEVNYNKNEISSIKTHENNSNVAVNFTKN